ncbi:DUF2490 domain-containing protein [Pontiellaceae bacterium B1224]|nr:DUF2490 domain-containing protein [Pontiellaceae bacterium B1224]
MKQFTTALTLFCGAALTTQAWDQGENAIWLEGTVRGNITDQLSASLKEQVRYRESDGFYFYRYTDFGLGWKFSNAWNVTAQYRYVTARKEGGNWVAKPMTHVNVNNKLPLGPVKLSTRLRFGFIDIESADNQTLIWPRFVLNLSKSWVGLNPYAAFETIYDIEQNLVFRNRFEGGLTYSPTKMLSLKMFLMQQLTRTASNSTWTEAYNAGAGATLKF